MYVVRAKSGRILGRYATRAEAQRRIRQLSTTKPRRSRSPVSHSEEWGDFHNAGAQDAANVMDPNQIEDELGPAPSRSDIEAWLLDQGDLEDFVEQNDLQKHPKGRQQDLRIAWAKGWSSYAAQVMASRRTRDRREDDDAYVYNSKPDEIVGIGWPRGTSVWKPSGR